MAETELLTAKEIASRFSMPEYVVYRMAKDGRITAHELPPRQKWHKRKRLGFDPAAVARALERPERG